MGKILALTSSKHFYNCALVKSHIQGVAQDGSQELEKGRHRRCVDELPKRGQGHGKGEVDHQFVEHRQHANPGT